MAEAARRYQQAGGSDLVRRLMARPLRLEQQARTRLSRPDQGLRRDGPATADPADDRLANEDRVDTEDFAAREDFAAIKDLDAADALARLEAEMQVMKAVLRAQRQEVAVLRAQRQLLTESAPSDDVRATRARWAALVDALLIRAPSCPPA